MRYRIPLAAFAVAVLTSACGDDSLSPRPTPPRAANPSVSATALTCDPAIIRGLITQLYSANGGGNVRAALLNKFDQGLGFMPNKKTQALKKFFDIIQQVDDDFSHNRLPVLTSPSTLVRRNELFARLLVCAGFTVPDLSGTDDEFVGFINDPSQPKTFISERRRLRGSDAARHVLRAGGDRRREAA